MEANVVRENGKLIISLGEHSVETQGDAPFDVVEAAVNCLIDNATGGARHKIVMQLLESAEG